MHSECFSMFFVCRTALLKFKIGYHPVIAQCILCVHNSITGVSNRISLYYRPGLILQCLPLVLAIGPEPLNVVIFAIRGICTTTALPVGNCPKATTIVLLVRDNVWCVLHLLKNKNKRL